MTSVLATIENKIGELVTHGDGLLDELETFGWKDERPHRQEEQFRSDGFDALDMVPESRRIPVEFVRKCSKWYASSLAILETNMASRRTEMASLMQFFNEQDYVTQSGQLAMAREIRQIQHLIGSIPSYMEGRLYDLELGLAQEFTRDQLLEAEVLLKARHVRAAGAIAGVLLERHLKLLCDRSQPPIKYASKAMISNLNELLWKARVYEQKEWRLVQWMGDVRNECDHANATEPEPKAVQKLIHDIKEFVANFII